MPQKVKRRKTPIFFVHKIVHNLGACLFIFNKYLVKILLLVGIGAGLFYMCARVEKYQNDDSIIVTYKHAHPSAIVGKQNHQEYIQPQKIADKPVQESHKVSSSHDDGWIETSDFSPDFQPFLPERVPFSFIQSEVRERMMEIEENVMQESK